MTIQTPRTQKQCKKLYKQLLKSAKEKGVAADVFSMLVGEEEWCQKLQQLRKLLENQESQ